VGSYASSYAKLRDEAGLTKDANVEYSKLVLVVTNDLPGFIFDVKHKATGSTVYHYESASTTTVTVDPAVTSITNEAW
jgi:hypothetical protein